MRPVDPMQLNHDLPVIDGDMFEKMRAQLGVSFVRLLGYFVEDGAKAVAGIEQAMRDHNAAQMVGAAHMLKSDARQFGANLLGDLAEEIECEARRCVEAHDEPRDLLVAVAQLRSVWQATTAVFERETNPLLQRRGMGQTGSHNQGFGRL